MGSITLDNSDFQCLQDQLVDLKAKNYDLAEKNRRSQADFEAAKARICSLQLKLEEQERDFQIISTTLRREIEALTGGSGLVIASQNSDNNPANKQRIEEAQEDFSVKSKELALKVEELEQKCQESKEIAQQLDEQNRELVEKLHTLQNANDELKCQFNSSTAHIESMRKDGELKLFEARERAEKLLIEEKQKLNDTLAAITSERDSFREEIVKLKSQLCNLDQKLEIINEERKIQERKGLLMVKELKRQLAQEKNRKETLQKRIEHLLSAPPPPPAVPSVEEGSTSNTTTTDIDVTLLSTSSSTNGNGSGGNANQDTNSIGSWSFVPVKTTTSTTTSNSATKSNNNTGHNETISLCSVESEDRETVQRLCDTASSDGSSKQQNTTNASNGSFSYINNDPSTKLDNNSTKLSPVERNFVLDKSNNQPTSDVYFPLPSSLFETNDAESKGMLIEEQAALVERLTKLQQDKWKLEEKLSYMEQANSSLTEDLANKSDIIRQYFMNKAIRGLNSMQTANHNQDNHDSNRDVKTNANNNNPRRLSFPSNVNEIISEKPSLKKVVDFLKEKSHNPLISSTGDSENISKEATRKMQIMLEETLIKCVKLQENLDFVTSELNKVNK